MDRYMSKTHQKFSMEVQISDTPKKTTINKRSCLTKFRPSASSWNPLKSMVSYITSYRQSWNSLLLGFLFLYLLCLIWNTTGSPAELIVHKTSFVPRLMCLFSWLLWCCTWVLVWCLALNYPLNRQKLSWLLIFFSLLPSCFENEGLQSALQYLQYLVCGPLLLLLSTTFFVFYTVPRSKA